MTKDTVEIHGQEYTLIATRLRRFREDHPDWRITTKLIHECGEWIRVKTTIRDDNGNKVATGHAEENRNVGNINSTSALENCETSSVGRALAFVSGDYAGLTIRSADEMADALRQQNDLRLLEHMSTVRDEWASISAIKEFLAEETPNIDAAREAFKELDEQSQHILWRAPTKGGVFTTLERKLLKEGTA